MCVVVVDFILFNMEIMFDFVVLVCVYIKCVCDIGYDIGCVWYVEDFEFGIGGDVDFIGVK